MKDMIPKGTGNSRKLKSSLSTGTTWEQALEMLRAGTFPIDLNGLNADGIQQEGTALNKANLLSDDTASALRLSGDPTVDDALGSMAFINQYVKRTTPKNIDIILGSEADVTLVSQTSTGATITIYYATSLAFDWSTGVTSLDNPNSVGVSYSNYTNANVLAGNYIKIGDDNTIYYIPPDAAPSRTTASLGVITYIVKIPGKPVSVVPSYGTPIISYSPNDPSNGANDESDIFFAGLAKDAIGKAAQCVRGVYIGTGTYGANNPNQITLGFEPTFLILFKPDIAIGHSYGDQWDLGFLPLVNGIGEAIVYNNKPSSGATTSTLRIQWGSTVQWYIDDSSTDGKYQFNGNGVLYNYVAIK